MSWNIIGTVTLSFAWVWSRWFSGPEAWKNDYLDYSVGIIAIYSWFVKTLDLILTPNLSQQLALEYSMFGSFGLLAYLVIYSGIWVGITSVFIRFRYKVANSQ